MAPGGLINELTDALYGLETEPVVRTQIAGGLPTDNLFLRLRSRDIVFAGASGFGNPVLTFTDIGGLGHDFTQVVAGFQANYVNGTRGPAVRFLSASATRYDSIDPAATWSFLHQTSTSVYMVLELTAPRTWNPVFTTSNNSVGTTGYHLAARAAGTFANANWSCWVCNSSGGFYLAQTSPNNSAPLSMQYIAQRLDLGVQGLQRPSQPTDTENLQAVVGVPNAVAPATTAQLGACSVGGTFLQGDFYELLVYTGLNSAAKDAAVRAFLQSEYGPL